MLMFLVEITVFSIQEMIIGMVGPVLLMARMDLGVPVLLKATMLQAVMISRLTIPVKITPVTHLIMTLP
jgi:hypothetical protein